jgi:hypothetical protein
VKILTLLYFCFSPSRLPTQRLLLSSAFAWSRKEKLSGMSGMSGITYPQITHTASVILIALCSCCLSTCAQTVPMTVPETVPAKSPQQKVEQKVASASTQPVTFTKAQYKAAIVFDSRGENGKLQSNAASPSQGYPCGVPTSYSWKYSTSNGPNPIDTVSGRGPQLAAAAYNQIYNACGKRKSMPNARVELTDVVVYYYSKKSNQWVKLVKQPIKGAAFAEDFVNNQATKADIREEAQGRKSVRSGIGNASSPAGSSTGRSGGDGPVGYNFHGFADRFKIDWTDAKAIVVAQAMRCIPHAGNNLSDCKKLGYIANVGLDSWASTTSNFDNFKTHGGVSGGRFKPVTTSWQVFTDYIGPQGSPIPDPPVPQF